jgi:RNA polymerase sigma factor for flagellar operon FliA
MDINILQHSDEQILAIYKPLVNKIALKIISKLPPNIQLDDLLQVGMMALLEAAKNYDPNKGASFTTYAGIRINGSIIDEIRREDWLPRSCHRNAKLLAEAHEYLVNNYDKTVTVEDISKYLNISVEEYRKLENNVNNYKIYNFDDIGISEDNLFSGSHEKDIFSKVENNLLRKAIDENIEKLPRKEKLVLVLYYDNELSLKQIGDILSLTESRVCQIHSQAMKHLEKYMSGWQ